MATILVVEDNELNRDMLSRRLMRRGFQVLLACDGQEGVSIARSKMPDLIIMDMKMPIMDGYEATRQLKTDPKTHDIPIVALTAYAMGGDLEKTLKAGCDDYASKPVDMEPLLEKMRAQLNKRVTA
jgi:CheY-like chemotaxis protein